MVYSLYALQTTLFAWTYQDKSSGFRAAPWLSLKKWPFYLFCLNTFLALNVADLVWRPLLYDSHSLSFARVGYVSEHSASILIREPDATQLPLHVTYQELLGEEPAAWQAAGSITSLSNETDYTSTIIIQQLQASTIYRYRVSNDLAGSFKTAPMVGNMPETNNKVTFLTSSCLKPRFPYHPLLHPRAIQGLKHVGKWLPRLQASFMLFLGDFIYIDVPRRYGTDAATYRHEYRTVYASPDWPPASNALPWMHVIDDHEIANDWDAGFAPPYPAAIDPWDIYHASVNPPPVRANASYFHFTHGLATFFMLDTRRFRSPSRALPADSRGKTMLGTEQREDLLAFLRHAEPTGVRWKIVVSSVPFTRNWRVNAADTWAGYLYERQIVLEAMWDVYHQSSGSVGVVVLSGDRHEFAATAFPPPSAFTRRNHHDQKEKHSENQTKWPAAANVYEFSTSPLSMFYLPIRTYRGDPGDDYNDKQEGKESSQREPCIKYVPDGNSKFGAVEMETVTVKKPVVGRSGDGGEGEGKEGGEEGGEEGGKGEEVRGLLRFRLFVDGVETWQYEITTPGGARQGGA